MNEIKAKLIRKIEFPDLPWFFNRYELECIDCGTHYFNGRYDWRTIPYCVECNKKHEKEKADIRKKQKAISDRNKVIDELIKRAPEKLISSYAAIVTGYLEEMKHEID